MSDNDSTGRVHRASRAVSSASAAHHHASHYHSGLRVRFESDEDDDDAGDYKRSRPRTLLDGATLIQRARQGSQSHYIPDADGRDDDDADDAEAWGQSIETGQSHSRKRLHQRDPVFVDESADLSSSDDSSSEDSDASADVDLPPALRRRVALLCAHRSKPTIPRRKHKRRRKDPDAEADAQAQAQAQVQAREMPLDDPDHKQALAQQALAQDAQMQRIVAAQQADIEAAYAAERGQQHADDGEAGMELPVQYVSLYDNRWQRDDADADSPHCFLCKFPGIEQHGGTRVQRMLQLISDRYGKISNEMLANAVQAYYNKNIRYFERRPNEAFPPWSKRMIIDHIERHCPTMLAMNYKTVRDMNSMIDVIQEQSLCVLDADNNKSVDQKNAKLLLQLVKERRACMREVERLTSTRR